MKFLIRQALKFLIKLAYKKPEKLSSKVALLYCESMKEILDILNDSNPDNEAQIEQMLDKQLMTFLQRAHEIKELWKKEQEQKTALDLLNHSSK